VKILSDFWGAAYFSSIVLLGSKTGKVLKEYPNAKLLNIKFSKHYFKIEQAVLSLDDEFSINKLKAMLPRKPYYHIEFVGTTPKHLRKIYIIN
jgi:hypothetical protein